ncbi:MAG TPA: MATE family efflux transporter, partial [Verrucomicrobiales bacterium]|nr:MATE family efflux transporter [Verrucomicrobiales bacterium]
MRYAGLKQLGQPQEVVNAAGLYLILFGSSILPALVTQAGKAYSEALNHPWEPTLILLGGVTLNIFLNWIFIYGNLGVPAMGLEGAGWATLIARILMSMVLLAYLSNSKVLRPFHPKAWWAALHLNCFRQLMTIGIPVAGQLLLEVGAFAFAAVMIGWISADAIAAHQIAITCAATTFMFPLGIGMAVCIRVGQAWGAGRYARMRRTGTVGFVAAGLLMGIFAAMFILAGECIAGLFIKDPAVIHLAANLLVIAALFQIADGFQVVAISALRGLSDVRIPTFIAIF